MSVPKYNELMLPLLQFASDGDEHHIRIKPVDENYFPD